MGISPLCFSTLCLYYYALVTKKAGVGASSVSSDPSNDKDKEGNNPNTPETKDRKSQNTSNNQTKQSKGSQNQSKRTKISHVKIKSILLAVYASRVMVGDKRQPICIPAGMSKVVVDKTQDKLPRGSYMVEATDDDNLPCGISVPPNQGKSQSFYLTPTPIMCGSVNHFMLLTYGMSS